MMSLLTGIVVVLLSLLVLCAEATNDSNSITTRTCYKHGDDVEIAFTVAESSGDEWIALVSTEVVDPSIDDFAGENWLSTCESQSRFCKLNAGSIFFNTSSFKDNDSTTSFIEPRRYNAYLLRGDDASILARSTTFKVTSTGTSCFSGCQSGIATNSNIYSIGDDIEVSFDNCHPAVDDWLGIYPEDANPFDLGDPVLWMWSCGSRDCRGKVVTDIWSFGSFIEPGKYRAILAKRNHDNPYSAKAVSSIFEIGPVVVASGCKDVMKMSSWCYVEGDQLHYEFTACQSKKHDWVGIFKSSTDLSKNIKPDISQQSCGKSHCRGMIDATTAAIATTKKDFWEGMNSWPLVPGEYTAVLVHENRGGSGVLTVAEHSFTVKPQGETCPQTQRRNLRSSEARIHPGRPK